MKRPARTDPLLCSRAPITAKNVPCRVSSGTGNSALIVKSSNARFRATWHMTSDPVRWPTTAATPSSGRLGKLPLHQSLRKPCTKQWKERKVNIIPIFAHETHQCSHLCELLTVHTQLAVVFQVEGGRLQIKAQRSPPLLLRSQVTRVHKRRLQKLQRETLLHSGTESLHFSMIVEVCLLGADGKRKED